MAFIDIKTAVLTNLIDLPAAVSAAVPKLINNAIRNAERRYNFKYMEVETGFSTVVGTLFVGSIINFKEYRDQGPYVRRMSSPAYLLGVVGDNGDVQRELTLGTSYPSWPKYISNSNADVNNKYNFNIWPYPDALSDWPDGSYQVYIPHYRYSAALVADADTNWLVNNADDYIIAKATAEGFKKDWDYNAAAVWTQDAENLFMEVRTTDKKLRLSGVTTLVTHWEGAKQGMVIR